MELKNVVIGTGTGLAVNSLVEKGMNNFWTKKGQELSAVNVARLKTLMNEGKTEDEAISIIEKENPLWKKLGSRRVNGILGIALGYTTLLISNDKTVKVAASGVVFSGALKVLFPSRMSSLEFSMSKVTDYINKHAMGAVWAARGSGILPETIICQSASESSWGESLLASKYNNYFGIKADSSWKGRFVTLLTREYINGRYISVGAKFRAYSSFAESASDYIQFLKKNKRYVNVFSQKTIYTQLVALKVAGYATEPNYATIINNIYLSNKTTIDTAIKKAKNNLSLAFAGIGLGVYFLVRKYLPQIVKSVKG